MKNILFDNYVSEDSELYSRRQLKKFGVFLLKTKVTIQKH